MNTVAISFIIFLSCFLGVGIYASTRKQTNTEDYLVASRSVSPWFMAYRPYPPTTAVLCLLASLAPRSQKASHLSG
jgi:Na+/pantothenate symporter